MHGQLSSDSIASVWKNPSIPNQERYKAFEQYYQSMISSSPIDVVGSSEQHWMLANASQSKKEMALAMDNKAHALCLLGEYDEAVQAIKDAYRISMELNDSLAMASKPILERFIIINLSIKRQFSTLIQDLPFIKAPRKS